MAAGVNQVFDLRCGGGFRRGVRIVGVLGWLAGWGTCDCNRDYEYEDGGCGEFGFEDLVNGFHDFPRLVCFSQVTVAVHFFRPLMGRGVLCVDLSVGGQP